MIGRQIFQEIRLLIGNERGFVHKKLLGLGKSIIPGVIGALPGIGQAVTAVRGVVGALRPSRPTLSRTLTARPSLAGTQDKEFGRQLKLGSVGEPAGGFRVGNGGFAIQPSTRGARGIGVHDPGPCMPPLIRNPEGQCVSAISPLGARTLVGEATMGRYGAALIPGSQIVDRATCLRGMQLGNDGLCYDKRNITNKQRMWPAGRKPLLTGGQMNAISIAARAAKRLEVTTKRLQRMGMMKKPATRRALPRGHVARLEHASEH